MRDGVPLLRCPSLVVLGGHNLVVKGDHDRAIRKGDLERRLDYDLRTTVELRCDPILEADAV